MAETQVAAPPARGAGRSAYGYVFTAEDTAVLRLVAANVSRADIAARLRCSRSTVTRHLAALCRRLGVRTTIEAVVVAVRAGVV